MIPDSPDPAVRGYMAAYAGRLFQMYRKQGATPDEARAAMALTIKKVAKLATKIAARRVKREHAS
jgi:hypothetical protein